MSKLAPSSPHKPLRQTIQFVRRGEVVTLHDVPPSRTLLEVLREDLHCTGTKEGCGATQSLRIHSPCAEFSL